MQSFILLEDAITPVLMPMLHSCSFPGCVTPTLNTYCFEHGLLIRGEIDAERERSASRDEPIALELAALRSAATAQPAPPA